MKKVLLAFNSFKEVSNSTEVCNLFGRFIENETKVHVCPISDGGDGFLEVCKGVFKLKDEKYKIKRFYDDQQVELHVGFDEKRATAYIETASAIGLKLIPVKMRQPKSYNTRSLGDVVKQMLDSQSIKKIIFGVGGTATMDMGLGICESFGLKGFDQSGAGISMIPENFINVADVRWEQLIFNVSFECIVDVNNPLLGEAGGLRVYGEQKGASKIDIKTIEDGVENLLSILKKKKFLKSSVFLSGSGGGFPAGLQIFFDAKVISSETFIADRLKVKDYVNKVDAVITGEGSFDKQSLFKKGTGVIIDLFKDTDQKIFLCCGKIDKNILNALPKNVFPIELSKYFNSTEESIKNFDTGLKKASEEIIEELNP